MLSLQNIKQNFYSHLIRILEEEIPVDELKLIQLTLQALLRKFLSKETAHPNRAW